MLRIKRQGNSRECLTHYGIFKITRTGEIFRAKLALASADLLFQLTSALSIIKHVLLVNS